MEARLFLNSKTKEELEKPISLKHKGELRFDRLKELEKSGELQDARNRYEIATMLGYPEERLKAGHCWVSSLITRKYLSETLIGVSFNGRKEYEYHIIGEPEYKGGTRGNWSRAKKNPNKWSESAERWKLVEELARDGKLDRTTRKELVKMAGYSNKRQERGLRWLSSIIQRGYLDERIIDAKYRKYSLTDKKPNYNPTRKKIIKQSVEQVPLADKVEKNDNNLVEFKLTYQNIGMELKASERYVKELVLSLVKESENENSNRVDS